MVEAVSVALNCEHDVCLILLGQGASGEAQLHLHLTGPNPHCQKAQALDLKLPLSSFWGGDAAKQTAVIRAGIVVLG